MRPAPSRLATCTAMAPALPIAPRSLCPGCGGTRRRSATQEDIAGFIAAATLATSTANLGYQEVRRCGCRLFIRAGQSL
jgi:hypothetical protein